MDYEIITVSNNLIKSLQLQDVYGQKSFWYWFLQRQPARRQKLDRHAQCNIHFYIKEKKKFCLKHKYFTTCGLNTHCRYELNLSVLNGIKYCKWNVNRKYYKWHFTSPIQLHDYTWSHCQPCLQIQFERKNNINFCLC